MGHHQLAHVVGNVRRCSEHLLRHQHVVGSQHLGQCDGGWVVVGFERVVKGNQHVSSLAQLVDHLVILQFLRRLLRIILFLLLVSFLVVVVSANELDTVATVVVVVIVIVVVIVVVILLLIVIIRLGLDVPLLV